MFKMTCALTLALCASAHAGESFTSDWAQSAKSRARLIADGAGGAGLQIELAPGAVTYWRDPGDSGAPPSFDFSGSTNLARASVDYPAPQRIAEPDGSEAFGYSGGVVFPFRVEPQDPAKPVTLAAKVNYAVCEKICLPARADLTIEIAPGGGASAQAARLAQARAATPATRSAAEAGLRLAATGRTSWRLCLPEAPQDLFVEGPPGYWIVARRETEANCYALLLRQAPADAMSPIEARVTFTGSNAAEVAVALKPS